MSTQTKKTSTTAVDVFERKLPNRKTLKLTLAIDLEQMFTLIEGVQGIDDDADVFTTMHAVRTIMPDEFLKQVKGVDAAVSLSLFMEYVQLLGERLGKALTTPAG